MKPHILLVDDHQMADDGITALDKLTSGQVVSLVISDNQMPVMTGIELLTKLTPGSTFTHSCHSIFWKSHRRTSPAGASTRRSCRFYQTYNIVELLANVKKFLSPE